MAGKRVRWRIASRRIPPARRSCWQGWATSAQRRGAVAPQRQHSCTGQQWHTQPCLQRHPREALDDGGDAHGLADLQQSVVEHTETGDTCCLHDSAAALDSSLNTATDVKPPPAPAAHHPLCEAHVLQRSLSQLGPVPGQHLRLHRIYLFCANWRLFCAIMHRFTCCASTLGSHLCLLSAARQAQQVGQRAGNSARSASVPL